MESYLEIILEDKIYNQRTPNSKFVEFSLDGIKLNVYEDLPKEIKVLVDAVKDIEINPDKYFDYRINNNEIEIINIYNTDLKYIKIPETIKGLPVTRIGEYVAMELKYSIEQIQLPESIEYLSEHSFSNLATLKYINIPKNIETIPEYCFTGCYNLLKINLENVDRINQHAFERCNSLKEITLKNIGYIAPFSFCECERLKKINIDGKITTISFASFIDCIRLQEINLCDNIKIIQEAAFKNCNIDIFIAPQNLLSIGPYAFACNDLKEVYLNKNLQSIYNDAFWDNDYCVINMYPTTNCSITSFSEKITVKEIER